MKGKKLSWFAWLLIVGVLGSIAFFSVRAFGPGIGDRLASWFPERHVAESSVPLKVTLPDRGDVTLPQRLTAKQDLGVFPQVSPSELQPGCGDLPEVRWGLWFWNTHNGMILANGGPQSARGSAMCAKGVNLTLVREDEVPNQLSGLVKFAQAYAGGEEYPRDGYAFVSFMGDGTAAILTEVNATLEKLGLEYRAQVVGSLGYSRGEDALMGPVSWRLDPQNMRGAVILAYLRDGDWDIGMKFAGDNGICNNPDERTYDPNCINWMAADSYTDAANKYVANACETRPVVSKGKKTGEERKVCADGVATWTPGDNIVADQRGGLVRIVATDTYYYQMPNAVIGIRKWMRDHTRLVDGMLEASFDANQTMRDSDDAMRRASALAAIVYHEQGADAAYIYKYFKGVTESDKQGLMVERGGSSVNNLADNCKLFGLQSCAPGSTSLYRATYETFGNIVVQQYPNLVPSYQPYEHVVDTSFLERIVARGAPRAAPDQPTFAAHTSVQQVISRRSWNISFDSGKATFSNGAFQDLQQLSSDLVIAGRAKVVVEGHTDATGNADQNFALSEARAFAVKHWLEKRDPVNFPKNRVEVVAYGQTRPVASNVTPEGRAQNRRVEVVIGTSN
ncbi:MAG: OmpA family protein [bacterium]|nr:OmpA family protein [bacterium]